jgi:transcription initiation factor IIE alpha subunit
METKTAEHAFQVDSLAPNIVEGIDKTGLEFGFLADLTLKTVYADADCSTERTAERLKLPMFVVEPILQHLYRERLIEIRQLVGVENHRYSILDRGWDRVQRLLDQSGYIDALYKRK